MEDLRKREQAEASAVEEERPRRRPELEELLAAACAVLDVEEWEFWQQPKRRGPRLARMIIAWIWVRTFKGTQAHVARTLKTHSSRVSTWYGQAVRRFPDLEPLGALRAALKAGELVPEDDPAVAVARVEGWSYDPVRLGGSDRVDPLSLFLSLRGSSDERIEKASKRLLEETA